MSRYQSNLFAFITSPCPSSRRFPRRAPISRPHISDRPARKSFGAKKCRNRYEEVNPIVFVTVSAIIGTEGRGTAESADSRAPPLRLVSCLGCALRSIWSRCERLKAKRVPSATVPLRKHRHSPIPFVLLRSNLARKRPASCSVRFVQEGCKIVGGTAAICPQLS